MLRSFTFGCGQGATKAMITAIDNGVLDKVYHEEVKTDE